MSVAAVHCEEPDEINGALPVLNYQESSETSADLKYIPIADNSATKFSNKVEHSASKDASDFNVCWSSIDIKQNIPYSLTLNDFHSVR